MQMFLLLCFVHMVIIKTQNRRQKKNLTTKIQNSNGLGPGATLLGWPKSIL